jgi:hypothetical protein
MKRRMWAALLCLLLMVSALPAVIPATPALAAGTESLTITKYDVDGITILAQTTVDLATLQGMTQQGDGTTHYYLQGPTMDPGNLWDPTETINLKDKGALKGTDIKDLCGLVGGMVPGDEVQVKASADGFNQQFLYDDVYNPEPEQGKLVICWWRDGEYVPDYADGMQLVFFAETTNGAGQHVFGNWDMNQCLPEENWHYFDIYPSSNGLSVKNIDAINIYTGPGWELTLDGASTYVMPQSEFEEGAGCHGASWDDGGDIWSGIPLWLLVGYVDDEIQHGAGAFNDDLAAAGYDINVIASDGYTKTFASSLVARNDDMIIANELNGAPLPADKYPLRLVGPGLTGGQKVSQIVEIELVGLPSGDASASLAATASVTLPTVGIVLDRDAIDYGEVGPGDSSAVETVGITNIGTTDVDVTLEVVGASATTQDFYEQSLHIDDVLYDPAAVIAEILTEQSEDVDTQLKVPEDWNHPGAQEATFIFWAEATTP